MHTGSSRVRTVAASILAFTILSCGGHRIELRGARAVQQNVETYQRALIARGVTGGSVAGVFRGEETLAYSIVNSGRAGDTPITADTIFPIWSMSKPITIAAMMILHERGLYEIDDPVSKYVPVFSDLRCKDDEGQVCRCRNELLVVHLLTHRSGYGYYDQGEGPSHMDPWEDLGHFVRVVAAHPVEFEPGTEYLYGLNQAILGRLVEVLSGQEFFVFLSENIFEPLGMTNTKFDLSPEDRKRFQVLFKKPDYEPTNAVGIKFDEGTSFFTNDHDELTYAPGTKAQLGGEGLVSTFGDYRHFCDMLLGKGMYRGKRILESRVGCGSVQPPSSHRQPGEAGGEEEGGGGFGDDDQLRDLGPPAVAELSPLLEGPKDTGVLGVHHGRAVVAPAVSTDAVDDFVLGLACLEEDQFAEGRHPVERFADDRIGAGELVLADTGEADHHLVELVHSNRGIDQVEPGLRDRARLDHRLRVGIELQPLGGRRAVEIVHHAHAPERPVLEHQVRRETIVCSEAPDVEGQARPRLLGVRG
jgi:CubicO group peptidase (beta-lactamase class C family)